MRVLNKTYYLVIVSLFLCSTTMAQDETSGQGEIQNAQIVIEKNREIVLPRETKVYEFIKWQPERSEFTMPKSRFVNYEYDQALMPIEFSPVSIPVSAGGKAYYQYAKAGFGNYGSPLVDVSLVTPGNSNMVAGLNFKHLSFNKGEVDGENSATSTNEANAYFMVIWDKVKLRPSLTYRKDKNYFYGYPEGTIVNIESIKKTNEYIDFGIDVEDNNDSDLWTYNTAIRSHFYSDNYFNDEKTLNSESTIGFDEKIYLNADMTWSEYDNGLTTSRSVYRVNPYYHLTLGELEIDLGLSANFQSDTSSVLSDQKFFPYLNGVYTLTDKFEVFATLDAGYDFNSMYSLSDQMPYLNPTFSVFNTQRNLDLSAGIRGDVSDQFFVEARIGYESLKNMALFVNNSTDQSLIDVRYDSSAVNIFNLGLTSKYQINAKNSVSLDVDYYGFNAGTLGEVYHRPNAEIKVKGDHQFIEKLNIQWQFNLLSGIKAYDPASDLNVALDVIPKLDLMAHYQIKDQWGAFVSLENILNKNYSRYLFYPQKGIMFKLGATYRF